MEDIAKSSEDNISDDDDDEDIGVGNDMEVDVDWKKNLKNFIVYLQKKNNRLKTFFSRFWAHSFTFNLHSVVVAYNR